MKTKIKFMAMAAMALLLSGCSHDEDNYNPSQSEQMDNATEKLGVDIDPSQSWNMTSTLEAQVTVALGLDETYTVVVYDVNPLFNDDAVFYAQSTVAEGGTATMTFNAPSADSTFYVAVFDSKYRSVAKSVKMDNNTLTTAFGTNDEPSASRRAREDAGTYPSFVKTLDDYLNPSGAVKVTLDEMKAYPAITDHIIVYETSNGNRTLSDRSSYYNPADFPAHGDGKHYRVAAGTTVTEKFNINATYGIINDAVIYVEGTLHLNGNTLNGPTLVVGSTGHLIIDGNTNMSNAGRFVVMAGGKITGNDGVEYNVNNGSACYNAGTINFKGQLNVNGSNTYNNGTINVDILRNTAGGSFTNFGQITARTNTIQGDAYNSVIVNGCYMHFTENAGAGGITLLDNSRLDVDGQLYLTNGNWGSTPSVMYNLSEINAGSVYFQSAKVNGPTAQGEFAVFKTSKMLVSYGGDFNPENNVYVDWNSKECYKYDGTTNYKESLSANDYKYCAAKGVIDNIENWSSEKSAAISIPSGDCTGKGYNTTSVPQSGVVGKPNAWTYAFEDTPLGDYDMNDVVIKVSYVYDEKTKVVDKSHLSVTLCCSGASNNLKVYLGSTALFGGNEVHSVLGQPKHTLINTGRGADVDYVTSTINTPDGFDFGTADFWVDSPSVSGGVHIAKQGQDPHGIVVPTDWAWPTEYTCIKEAYPNFVEFAKDASTTDETIKGWYKTTANPENPVQGKVYTK